MREWEHRRKFVADLLEVIHQVDNDQEMAGLGSLQDFDSPKSLYSFDPYSQFNDEEVGQFGSFDQQMSAL